jgi:peroxiredoxin
MKKLLVLFSLLAVMTGCINEDVKTGNVSVGDALPEFEVVMNDGSVVSDASLKGSVSVVMFFHISCPDCQQALPVVQTIYDEYLAKGVKFALVSRECSNDEIMSFWKEKGLNLPYSAQNDRTVYSLFASSRIPRIYISDENGTVRYIFTDDPVPSYSDLKSSLDELIR